MSLARQAASEPPHAATGISPSAPTPPALPGHQGNNCALTPVDVVRQSPNLQPARTGCAGVNGVAVASDALGWRTVTCVNRFCGKVGLSRRNHELEGASMKPQ